MKYYSWDRNWHVTTFYHTVLAQYKLSSCVCLQMWSNMCSSFWCHRNVRNRGNRYKLLPKHCHYDVKESGEPRCLTVPNFIKIGPFIQYNTTTQHINSTLSLRYTTTVNIATWWLKSSWKQRLENSDEEDDPVLALVKIVALLHKSALCFIYSHFIWCPHLHIAAPKIWNSLHPACWICSRFPTTCSRPLILDSASADHFALL